MASLINASTTGVGGIVQTGDASGILELQGNGTTVATALSTGFRVNTYSPATSLITSSTIATATGTAVDFTNIPSWVKRITVMFQGISTSGSSLVQVQLGAGSVTTTGYKSAAVVNNNANSTGFNIYTTGFGLESGAPAATTTRYGQMIISLLGSNTWCYSYNGWMETYGFGGTASGSIVLAGTLDRVRITTVNGTDTFDAGTVNILYE